MLNRDTKSNFLDSLSISDRGIVKVASSQVPGKLSAVTEQKVKKVLKSLGPKHKELVQRHEQQLELGAKPQDVAKSLLTGLTSGKQSMFLSTAMTLRQAGMFKVAGRDVYEDLDTGEFWKISEDKKNVVRLFKEDEKGIADKRASFFRQIAITFADDKNENLVSKKRESAKELKHFLEDFKNKFGEEPNQDDEDESPFKVVFDFTPEQLKWVKLNYTYFIEEV